MSTTTITQKELKSIAKAIVDVSDPLRIILFGSRARGNANKNSDIDILVIGERPNAPWSRRRLVGDMRRSLPDLDVPVDILFFTPDEMTRWQDTTNHIVREALDEGDVLYERP